MEKVIAAGDAGIRKKKIVPESILELQNLIRIKMILGKKLAGTSFEAARIPCTRRRKRILEIKVSRINSWVRFIKINKREELVLAPSIKALDVGAEPLDARALSESLDEIVPAIAGGSCFCRTAKPGVSGASPDKMPVLERK